MFDLIPFEHRNHGLFNPFADFDRFFDDLAKESPCKTDILDKGDHYLVQAEMPGFNKEDIHIDVDGDCLTITAEHKEDKEEKEDKKGSFIRRERRYGSLSRSFDISGIDADKIGASYQNGVLELTLPKRGEVTPPARRIDIK